MIFALYLFLISKASKLSDKALVVAVEDTFEECASILQAVDDFIVEIHDDDVRRRDEKNAVQLANQVENKLDSCGIILDVAENFRKQYFMQPIPGKINLEDRESRYVNSLLKPQSMKMGEVLFVASRDGQRASDFHSACDNRGATVVIVETKEGAMFGGYSDISWGSSTKWVASTKSFLFRLRPSMKQYKIQSARTTKAIYHHSSYGPTFGGGHDLTIKDNPLTSRSSATNGGNTYVFPTNPSYELTNGIQIFLVKDYVVLKAMPL